MQIDYKSRPPGQAFDEMLDALIHEGIPLKAAAESPVIRLLFYAGMVAANGTTAKQLRDFRGQYTELLAEAAADFNRQCVYALAKQSEEGVGYELDLVNVARAPGRGAVRETETGARETRPDGDSDDRVLRRSKKDRARDRTRGADIGGRDRGSRSVFSQATGLYGRAESSTRTRASADGKRPELTGNPVVDYWITTGCLMVPANEREAALGQIVELAFYMGASFFGGQVGDALSVDGSHCDEITTETFSFLAASAIAAMETAGGTMAFTGRAYADRDEPETD